MFLMVTPSQALTPGIFSPKNCLHGSSKFFICSMSIYNEEEILHYNGKNVFCLFRTEEVCSHQYRRLKGGRWVGFISGLPSQTLNEGLLRASSIFAGKMYAIELIESKCELNNYCILWLPKCIAGPQIKYCTCKCAMVADIQLRLYQALVRAK